MRIEFVPSSAVPVNVIAHNGTLGAWATPVALQLITVPLKVPCAVPATFRSPAQDALNEPFAVVAVCSVGLHWKPEQLDTEGITLDADAHVPISALTPAAVGLVVVLVCSKPAQPAAATANANADTNM
jgi:hypothetical protein